MNKEQELYLSIGRALGTVVESQLFGKPCFKINGKAFVCFFENEMVFKLEGEALTDALSLDGAQRFDPSKKGRPMKAWIQLPYDYRDKWEYFAKAAMRYVETLSK